MCGKGRRVGPTFLLWMRDGHYAKGIVGPRNAGEGEVCRSDISMVGERRGTIPTELLDQQTPVAEGYVGPTIPW